MHRAVPAHRLILTALLSVLLLFLQQESARHALDHIGAQIERSKHSALERPTCDVCLECELLAGGTSGMPASWAPPLADASGWIEIVAPVARVSVAAPSFYRSRAPPPILRYA
jgi:hypothetical protein